MISNSIVIGHLNAVDSSAIQLLIGLIFHP